MKILIINSLDDRYGSTYRIRAFAAELYKTGYEVFYYEKKIPFILKFFAIQWLCLKPNYDALIVQKFNPLTFFPILIAKFKGKYVVADWDDWDTGLQKNIGMKAITWFCEKILPRFPDLITTHNSNLQHKIPKHTASLLLEQGYDPELFNVSAQSSSDSKIRVGYLCTFTSGGTLDLQIIFQEIAKVQDVRITFVIIGGGKLLEKFINMAKKLQISNIEFTGQLAHHEIPRVLATLDYGLVYMTETEANRTRVSFKVIEYLASGLTVIGQTVGETNRLFGHYIQNQPIGMLSSYLQTLSEQPKPLKNRPDALLNDFIWSKIIGKLHQHLALKVQ